MSEETKNINKFFNEANKGDVVNLQNNIFFKNKLQEQIFEMKYMKGYDINFIAYKTGYSRSKIESDLRKIRKKIVKLI